MKAVVSFVLFFSAIALAAGPRADVAGSADHPLLTRFPGSSIIEYRQVAYDEYVLPLGKSKRRGEFDRSETVAGKLTSLEYKTGGGHSVLEIFENYTQALHDAGFDVLFTCVKHDEMWWRPG